MKKNKYSIYEITWNGSIHTSIWTVLIDHFCAFEKLILLKFIRKLFSVVDRDIGGCE